MSDDLVAAGELVGYGLDPRLSPGRNQRYAELVTRFRNDSVFRHSVEAITDGQGLAILDCSPVLGLVLTSSGPDSPYYMRLDDYGQMRPDERHLQAFVFLAIATACYPTPEALEAEDGPLPQLTVDQVLRLMNRMADRMKQRGRDVDPPVDQPQLEPLYRLVLRWRDGDTTGDDRSNPRVKAGMIKRALKWLAANGFADEIAAAKDSFRIRSRFRLYVKDAVGQLGSSLAHLKDLSVEESA